jgi:hypothetical protein
VGRHKWLQIHRPLSPRAKLTFGILSFVLPILLWCIISYVPAVWHPQIMVTDPGSVTYLDAAARHSGKSHLSTLAGRGDAGLLHCLHDAA